MEISLQIVLKKCMKKESNSSHLGVIWKISLLFLNRAIFIYYTFIYHNNQTRKSIKTKHNKYNRHATTNQIILSLVTEVNKKYLPEDGQSLTETCRRILRILKQYDHFNVLF